MLGIEVDKQNAECVRVFLQKNALLAKQYYFNTSENCVQIPIAKPLGETDYKNIARYGVKVIESDFKFKKSYQPPFENICEALATKLGDKTQYLPRKWELIGDVLILKIPPQLADYEAEIASTYAKVLCAKTVLKDIGGIELARRKPTVKTIYGTDTVTFHIENKVIFKLDAAEMMFSSGNIDERVRLAKIAKKHEIVADMFAGIGYFSIPIAVHSKPAKIYASEMFEPTYKYLCENILLNNVSDVVQPLLGDTRFVMPDNIADRVIMGWLDGYQFLEKAFKILRQQEGIIHYHACCHESCLPQKPVEELKGTALKFDRRAEVLKFRYVKSYAPRVWHVVVDCKVAR